MAKREEVEVLKSSVRNLSKIKRYEFDDRYVTTNDGKVYLVKEEKGNKLICNAMHPFETRDGYIEYVLTLKDGTKKHVQAQIIVACLYVPLVKGKDYVNHKDGKRDNNKYSNLEWSTVSENLKHSYDKLGRVAWNKK